MFGDVIVQFNQKQQPQLKDVQKRYREKKKKKEAVQGCDAGELE